MLVSKIHLGPAVRCQHKRGFGQKAPHPGQHGAFGPHGQAAGDAHGRREFALSHEPRTRPDCLYFSLGDRESRTGNPYLQTVQARTEELEARFAAQGVRTVFELNPGSHNKNAAARTAAGIRWILNR